MRKLRIENFNFGYFLGGRTLVDNLVEGAKKFGGATKFDNGIYSNVEADSFIKVNDDKNRISIFIPSTENIDKECDNSEHVRYVYNLLKLRYPLSNIKFYKSEGSWYSEDLGKVVVEDITIVSLDTSSVCDLDVYYFLMLADYVKDSMKQEAVSIMINDSLAII